MCWWSTSTTSSPTAGRSGCSGKNSPPIIRQRARTTWQHCLRPPSSIATLRSGSRAGRRRRAAKEQLDYWRVQLDGVITLPLRTDRPRPEVWSGHGARHYLEFSKTLSADLRALSQNKGVTPFMTLLAVLQCLLFRHTGQEDVATGSLIANRNQIESERLIGVFANTLILRNDFGGDPSFGDMLRRVRQVTLDAYRNQDLPIEEVLRSLQIARRTDGNPLFRIMFILQNASIEAARFSGLSTRRIEIDPKVARFDITLELVEADGRFTGFFEYATDLFDAATIEGMAAQFKTLLKSVIADPEQRISRLALLTEAERRQLLAQGRGVPANFVARGNLSEGFDRQVKKTPNAIAVSDGRTSLSYRELARRSQAAARWLTLEGVGAEAVVALLADRGPRPARRDDRRTTRGRRLPQSRSRPAAGTARNHPRIERGPHAADRTGAVIHGGGAARTAGRAHPNGRARGRDRASVGQAGPRKAARGVEPCLSHLHLRVLRRAQGRHDRAARAVKPSGVAHLRAEPLVPGRDRADRATEFCHLGVAVPRGAHGRRARPHLRDRDRAGPDFCSRARSSARASRCSRSSHRCCA
ncbi:hypothetical protein ACVWZL_000883 [Bradyrhizobium sp. GM2.4]